jgi:hypothetical protein
MLNEHLQDVLRKKYWNQKLFSCLISTFEKFSQFVDPFMCKIGK